MLTREQDQQLPPASGRQLSLAGRRERYQREGPSPAELTGQVGPDGIFRQDIPVLSKNVGRPLPP